MFASLVGFSQTDFNYQAIIKEANGMAVSGQSITMKFSVIYDAANGTVSYQETHQITTSVNGLINLVIGSGTPTSQTGDSWGAIDWGRPLFLKEEVNLGGGFTSLGTGRIYSVPIANYAAKAGAIKGIISGAISTTTITATNIDAKSIQLPGFNPTTGVVHSYYGEGYVTSRNISVTNASFIGTVTTSSIQLHDYYGSTPKGYVTSQNISVTNASFSGVVTASAFKGDGSGLNNITAGAITGIITAPISTTHVTATTFSGDGSALTNLPSSGANNQIWISHALFERTGSQNIASKTGVFNGYYYEFLNLKKGSSGISQTRATFVPPSHWGNGNYKVTLYFLTENANSGNIQVDWGIQVLTMSGNNVSAGNDFIGNNNGAFQYGTTIGAPPANLTAAAQTANNKRPLQKYSYTYNYNFSGIDFATLHMSRYLNQGYSYSDTYDGDFYVVGIKIEKNY